MKIPLNFRLKCPSLESVTYHCLRILGIFIGVAAIIYFMYDGKIRDSGSKRRAQERLIRRKIVVLIMYCSWIIGIILEKAILMWFVLYVVIVALAYCVFEVLSVLLPICAHWIYQKTIPDEAYVLLAKYSIASVFFLLMFFVHYFIYKTVDKGIKENQNEEKTLLNKEKSTSDGGERRCGIRFPCCV